MGDFRDIRVAKESDAADFLSIYAQYISMPVTFECTVPSEADFRARIRTVLETHPWLAVCENGRISGYAYAHSFHAREAYQWGAELSVYLDSDARAHGLGTVLYSCLISLLKAQGVRTVYGCVTLPNPASEFLHAKFGFRAAGVFRNAGFKNGEWHDVGWFEKALGPYVSPEKLIPFSSLDSGRIHEILEASSL